MENNFRSLDYTKLKNTARIRSLINNKMIPRIKCNQNFGEMYTEFLWHNKSDRAIWMSACKRVIEDEFASMIQEYKAKDKSGIIENNNSNEVWCCWLQGEEKMPEVVRMCINSQMKNIPDDKNYHLLTYKNIDDYIELPGYLFDNVKKGTLTLTHLSDMIRFKLLYERGGMWMDSTLFVSNRIPESYLLMPIYSIQEKDTNRMMDDVFYGALCSFLIGGSTNGLLFDFCYNLMIDYQKRFDWLVEAHLINITYAIAYTSFPKIRKAIESIGQNNANRQALNNISNDVFEAKTYEELVKEQIFHKLNWRKKYISEVDGKETYFGYAYNSIMQS